MPDFGYAGEILKINLSDRTYTSQPSRDYTEKYVGGHGVAARLYWEMVPAETRALDPANCLIAASGPIAGFPGFAGARWKICGKTVLDNPESFSYCNLGERWGSTLKFAGYDALAIQGKSEKPVYVYIHDGKVEIKDASHIWGLSTFETSDVLKSELGRGVCVLTIGPAAENLVPFSTVLAEGGASGSGGMGVVMGSKNLKAVVVAGNKRPVAAHPDKVRELLDIIRTNNKKSDMLPLGIAGLTRIHPCYGCGIGCYREIYPAEKGRDYKALCQASTMYMQAVRYNKGVNDGKHLLATRLCDGYGLDSSVMQSMIEFLEFCFRDGVITEKQSGLPLSKIGSDEFIRELTRQISLKKDFGALLSQGIIAAAASIGPAAQLLVSSVVATRGSEKKDYDPRWLITTAIPYATEPRRPIQQLHEVSMLAMMWQGTHGGGGAPGKVFTSADFRKVARVIWGSELAADFSTYEGKALAAKMLQDRIFAKESLVVCDLRWTMSQVGRILGTTGDTVNPAHIYSAVTGRETDEAGLSGFGERIFNLHRAILLRQGWPGRRGDNLLDYYFTQPLKKDEIFFNSEALMPGHNGEIISRVGTIIEREKFEQMKTDYYNYRGWDAATGYPTRAKLRELGLSDVADGLEKQGLVK